MAYIPDSRRGLDPGRFDNFKRGTRDNPILVPRPMGVEAAKVANRRESALKLGKIFLELRADARRLGDWALPTARTAMDERVLAYQLDAPTQIVLGADIDLKTRIRTYDRYFDAVIPEVAKKAQEWGLRILKEQSQLLRLLWLEIADDSFGAWMNGAAREITRRAIDCLDRKRKDAPKSGVAIDPRYARPADQQKRARELLDAAKSCFVAAAKSFVASDKIESSQASYLQPQIPFAKKVRYLQLLQILLAHPRQTRILLAYSDSAAKGTLAAKQLIRESYDAVKEFSTSLAKSPRSVWRYPVLIVSGIQELGLGDLDGFQEYAIEVGAVLASKSPETLLNYIGLGLFAVAFVSGVGTGAAILDLAIGGASAFFSFVRERQQEQAVKASLFLPDQSKFATEFGYGDTSLAFAFMLLAAMSLFRTATAARAQSPARSATPQKEALRRPRPASLTNQAPELPNPPKQEPKRNVVTDATRGKESPANARPPSGKSSQANTIAQVQDADVKATGPNPPSGGEAPKAPPPQTQPVDDFPELKLALNEAPAVANPTAELVADAIKAFKKQLKRLNAEGLKAARFKDFYLTPRQAQTFSRLSDAILNSEGRLIPKGLTADRAVLLKESELNAENLRRRLKAHWDAALPKRGKQTAEEAALEILTKLKNDSPEAGTLNSNIRDKFFENWKSRFLRRVRRDDTLIRDLEVQAGVVFGSENGPSAFCVLVRDEAGRFNFISLDLDHAVIRHEDAVLRALRTNDATLLTSTVDSANLQLMTARENRFVIERLRELDQLYWSVRSGPVPQAIQPFR